MSELFLLSLAALAALVPFAILCWRGHDRASPLIHWVLLAVAFAGAAAFTLAANSGGWNPSFAASLWISIAATLAGYGLISLRNGESWRLARVLMPYLLVLGLLATIWSGTSRTEPLGEIGPWLGLHLMLAVATYAAATLAAIAGLAVFLQERALKSRHPGPLSAALPSVKTAEALSMRLLGVAVAVLFIGIVTGVAELYITQNRLIQFDHKTVFSLLALLFLTFLLVLHVKSGLRGRRAARLILIGYLFITLAFPGVKLVSDVILG